MLRCTPRRSCLVGEPGEPALDEVEPRAVGRGEVQMEPRTLGEPAADERGLVRAVVVQNQVDVEVCRHGGVDRVQELAELDGAMAARISPMTLPVFTSSAANSVVVPWR